MCSDRIEKARLRRAIALPVDLPELGILGPPVVDPVGPGGVAGAPAAVGGREVGWVGWSCLSWSTWRVPQRRWTGGSDVDFPGEVGRPSGRSARETRQGRGQGTRTGVSAAGSGPAAQRSASAAVICCENASGVKRRTVRPERLAGVAQRLPRADDGADGGVEVGVGDPADDLADLVLVEVGPQEDLVAVGRAAVDPHLRAGEADVADLVLGARVGAARHEHPQRRVAAQRRVAGQAAGRRPATR